MFAIGVIVVITLLGYFLCSLMEAALYSIPRSRIESLKRSGDPNGIRLSKLRDKIDEPIAAILTLNTAINIIGATWSAGLISKYYGNVWLGVFSGVFTGAVLFISEILPKSLGVTFASSIAPRLAGIITFLVQALWPFVKLTTFITRIWGGKAHINFPSEEDVISLALLSRSGHAIMSHEARMVVNALRLDRLKAQDIMTPRSVVYSLSGDMSLKEIDIDSDNWYFSRMPVYDEKDPHEIIGIVNRRDIDFALLKGNQDIKISRLMLEPDFVQGMMPLHELLDKFIATHRHLFCVRDENNEFIGVVSLEDVVESLIGKEIVDESDIYEDMQELAKTKEPNKISKK
jgi:CBS domain containing-hemolysin-like protein